MTPVTLIDSPSWTLGVPVLWFILGPYLRWGDTSLPNKGFAALHGALLTRGIFVSLAVSDEWVDLTYLQFLKIPLLFSTGLSSSYCFTL